MADEIRGWLTLVLLLVFVAFMVWIFLKRNKAYFDEAGKIPFKDDDIDAASQKPQSTPTEDGGKKGNDS